MNFMYPYRSPVETKRQINMLRITTFKMLFLAQYNRGCKLVYLVQTAFKVIPFPKFVWYIIYVDTLFVKIVRECHRSSKTCCQLFCKVQSTHPNLGLFAFLLGHKWSCFHFLIWLKRGLLPDSGKSFECDSIWGSECRWRGNKNFHEEPNLADILIRWNIKQDKIKAILTNTEGTFIVVSCQRKDQFRSIKILTLLRGEGDEI